MLSCSDTYKCVCGACGVEMYNSDAQSSEHHLKPISISLLVAKVALHSRRETVRPASTSLINITHIKHLNNIHTQSHITPPITYNTTITSSQIKIKQITPHPIFRWSRPATTEACADRSRWKNCRPTYSSSPAATSKTTRARRFSAPSWCTSNCLSSPALSTAAGPSITAASITVLLPIVLIFLSSVDLGNPNNHPSPSRTGVRSEEYRPESRRKTSISWYPPTHPGTLVQVYQVRFSTSSESQCSLSQPEFSPKRYCHRCRSRHRRSSWRGRALSVSGNQPN